MNCVPSDSYVEDLTPSIPTSVIVFVTPTHTYTHTHNKIQNFDIFQSSLGHLIDFAETHGYRIS